MEWPRAVKAALREWLEGWELGPSTIPVRDCHFREIGSPGGPIDPAFAGITPGGETFVGHSKANNSIRTKL